MPDLGTTLRCNCPPRHIWVVLSDPNRTGGEILLVNLTSLTDDCVDDACILEPEDFVLLTTRTTVAYSRSQVGRSQLLDALIANRQFTQVTAVPQATLQRMLQGGNCSPELSSAKKALLG